MWWSFTCGSADQAEWLRPAFVAYLTARGSAEDDYFAAEIIFGELIANVVQHAPGPIRIDVRWTEGRQPLLTVTDFGPGFALAEVSPENLLAESGRGLFLIKAFSDGVKLEPHPDGGNSISVTLRIRYAGNGIPSTRAAARVNDVSGPVQSGMFAE